jgi:hypothetical protein
VEKLTRFAYLTSANGFHTVLRSINSRETTEMDPTTGNRIGEARERIVNLLRGRNKKARFMTELYASLERSGIKTEEADRVLAALETEVVMIRHNFCADPHLTGVDLRVVALVESAGGGDPQMSAIRLIDETWNKWLSEYLANHRCG